LGELEYVELRLKKALVPMEPSADFSRNLIERLNDAAEESWAVVEEPSDSFTSTVMDRIQEEITEEVSPRNWKPLIRAGMLLAASVLVFLGVFLFRGDLGSGFLPEEGRTATLFQLESMEGKALLLDGPRMNLGMALGMEEGSLFSGFPNGETNSLSKGSAPHSRKPTSSDAKSSGSDGIGSKGHAPSRQELVPGNSIPLGKDLVVQGGEATILARASLGGTLVPGWQMVVGAGSQLGFEKATRSVLRKGRVRISRSEHGQGAGGDPSSLSSNGGPGSFFLGFPGGGGLLLPMGKAEIDVSDDPWAVATGLPDGASKIQVDLLEGEGFLVDISGNALQKLLPGDRVLMRPFEPLRISHRSGVSDILSEGTSGLRSAQSPSQSQGKLSILQGRFRTTSGSLAPGMRLRLVLPHKTIEGFTDPSGSFSFSLQVDEIVFGAFLSVTVSGTPGVLRFEVPPLRPGGEIDLHLTLPSIESLPTRILNPDGTPMVGAKLRLYQWEPLLGRLVSLEAGSLVSDPAGRVHFAGVPLPQVDQRILLVVDPREGPLFVGYLDRSTYQRLQRKGEEWLVTSPQLLSVLLEAPGVSRIQIEERPNGPARSLLLRRREQKVVGGRARIKLALPAPKTIRWWTKDAEGARVHEGRIVFGGAEGARVLTRETDRLQVQVLDSRGEGLSGRAFLLLRRKDGVPVLFGKTAKGGFANLILVDPRKDLELRVADQGHFRSFDLPSTGDLLVARISFGRIALEGGTSVERAMEASYQSLNWVGPLRDWRPFSWKDSWKESRKGGASVEGVGTLQLSLTAGGGARVVPSARVYLLSEEGGLALLGASDLLGQLRIMELPAGPVLRLLVVHPDEGVALAELMIKAGETRRMVLELLARRRVEGDLPPGSKNQLGSRFVEVEVLGGPFSGTRTVTIPGVDGKIDLKDLPAGPGYRFRYGEFEAHLLPSLASKKAGDLEILDPQSWKRVAK
jgi:hypothetical protein